MLATHSENTAHITPKVYGLTNQFFQNNEKKRNIIFTKINQFSDSIVILKTNSE